MLAWSQLEEDIYVGDPAYFWKLKPNLNRRIDNGSHSFTFQTNSAGFRDDEWQDGGTMVVSWVFDHPRLGVDDN